MGYHSMLYGHACFAISRMDMSVRLFPGTVHASCFPINDPRINNCVDYIRDGHGRVLFDGHPKCFTGTNGSGYVRYREWCRWSSERTADRPRDLRLPHRFLSGTEIHL